MRTSSSAEPAQNPNIKMIGTLATDHIGSNSLARIVVVPVVKDKPDKKDGRRINAAQVR